MVRRQSAVRDVVEKLPALTFPPDHPFPPLAQSGSMEDLSAASLEDISHFFATYYTPDNAVLSIAGDFDPVEARRLVEEYYGPIPRAWPAPLRRWMFHRRSENGDGRS
jgi:predicted Zn-dependent peptidase